MPVMFEDWSAADLRALKKKLESMYVQGVRQSTFKDQTLIFVSSIELKQRITDISAAISEKDEACGNGNGTGSGKNKKQVRITTRNKGFQ